MVKKKPKKEVKKKSVKKSEVKDVLDGGVDVLKDSVKSVGDAIKDTANTMFGSDERGKRKRN